MANFWFMEYALFLIYWSGLLYLSLAERCRGPVGLKAVSFERRSFTSPNYPNEYPSNSDCLWRIDTEEEGYVVQLFTEDCKLENQWDKTECRYDRIQVFHGENKLREWCGTSRPSLVSPGSSLTVIFQSDQSYGDSGFKISYMAISSGSLTDPAEDNGVSLTGLVGYVVLVLATLTVGVILLRIGLSRLKPCKGIAGPRLRTMLPVRSPVTRPTRDEDDLPPQGVFVLPVEPPAYDGRFDPPPYSEINLNESSTESSTDNNTSFNSVQLTRNNTLPPSYESVMGETNFGMVSETADSSNTSENSNNVMSNI